MQAAVESLFRALRNSMSGVRALMILGSNGEVLAHAAADPRFDIEAFSSEYATFLLIARRTSQDAGLGDIDEHVTISAGGTVIVRRLPTDHFAVLVCSGDEQLGRLRYELKRSLLYSTFSHL